MVSIVNFSILTYLLIGVAGLLFIACVVLLLIVLRLTRKLRENASEAQPMENRSEAAILCRSCAGMFPASKKRCPHCGAKT